MNLPIHVFRKDLRRWWPLGAFAAAYIIVETLAPLWGLNFSLNLRGSELNQLIGAFAKWPVVFILVVAVMQEDRTVGDTAFWRTRPIAAGGLLAGKLLFFTAALALPSLLANLTIARLLDTPGAVTLGIAVETIGFTLLGVLASALLASLTGTLLHAGLAALGGLLLVMAIGAVRDVFYPSVWVRLPWDTDVPYAGGRVAVACVLGCLALVALLAHQTITRRTGRTAALLGLAIPVVLGVAVRWTVMDPGRIPDLQPYPDKPLAPSENFAFTLDLPARLNGTSWVWDAAARRSHREQNVDTYADLTGAIPGRFFAFLESTSTLRLRDGRVVDFAPIRQHGYAWSSVQRDAALCRGLGLDYIDLPKEPDPQSTLRLFSAPPRQLAELAGARGQLTVKFTLGELAFAEVFRLPARVGATRHQPGATWRLEEITHHGEEVPTRFVLRFLHANTMLAPYGAARADIDPNPTDGKFFFLVNRARASYASARADPDESKPGLISSARFRLDFHQLRSRGLRLTDTPIDEAWLAGAELIVVQIDHLGKTEKTVVVEDFVVPRMELRGEP